ncbi:hypothetical protein [Vreelandella alkaliphila]|uniref:Uncharacterized protein n=1 Tax=Vreelandella alkaliphila TaxID=272774 RepID=A0AAJ2VSF8_9GAMM|nr:hypothetical protein [Halomonas alkaliphila]MDX5979604.1 hypothetical protein [Halomonas alkaliphila]
MSIKRCVVVVGAGVALAASALSMSAVADSSITLTGAAGEFENRVDTSRYTAEVRVGVIGDAYAVVHAGAYDHPRPEIEDRVMVGAGYTWRNWSAEFVGDDDRFLTSVMFTAPTDVWEIKGGVLHGNKWQEGFKQTGLKVSVGYPVLAAVTVGGFYEIGNTTMTSVDDLYGGYVAWAF